MKARGRWLFEWTGFPLTVLMWVLNSHLLGKTGRGKQKKHKKGKGKETKKCVDKPIFVYTRNK